VQRAALQAEKRQKRHEQQQSHNGLQFNLVQARDGQPIHVTCSVQLCRQRSARSAMSSSSHTMGFSLTWYRHVMANQSTQL
jgi:hypothetical protein